MRRHRLQARQFPSMEGIQPDSDPGSANATVAQIKTPSSDVHGCTNVAGARQGLFPTIPLHFLHPWRSEAGNDPDKPNKKMGASAPIVFPALHFRRHGMFVLTSIHWRTTMTALTTFSALPTVSFATICRTCSHSFLTFSHFGATF